MLFSRDLSGTEYDGGHGMIFVTNEGKKMLSVHSPNGSGEGYHETAVFNEIVEVDGTLYLKAHYDELQKTRKTVTDIFGKISEYLSKILGFIVGLFAKITNI